MPIPKKTQRAVEEAIQSTTTAVLDEYMKNWQETPPDQMNEHERRLFDAIAEFEIVANRKVAEILSGSRMVP